MTTPAPLRLVLADDHPVVRDGLKALLGSLDGVSVVGEASTGREAVRQAVTLRPDVLIMDLQMPDLDGVAATRQITKVTPEVAVLVLSMFDDDDNVYDAMRAGARGYLLKGASQDVVARAIFDVASGGAVFGPSVANRLLARLVGHEPAVNAPLPQLTNRERQVLDLVAVGLRNPMIAARLGVSDKTVGNHLSSIFAKLHVDGRSQAIIIARDQGLGRP
ncbi:MAG: response regulator transcription factor [Ornithinibacter sp.]